MALLTSFIQHVAKVFAERVSAVTVAHSRRRNGHRIGPCGAGLAVAAVICLPYGAWAQPSGETLLKAAFLYNFAKFVEWPEKALPNEAETFAICVIGDEPMTQAVDRMLRDKQVQGRTVVTRPLSSVGDAAGCHILFVDAAAVEVAERTGHFPKLLPILTVGESDRFIQSGGVIKFFVEDGKLRFEISPQAAARAQLKISSKLLKLGRIAEAP